MGPARALGLVLALGSELVLALGLVLVLAVELVSTLPMGFPGQAPPQNC